MKRRKHVFSSLVTILFTSVLVSFNFSATAQNRKFQQHQIITITGGQKIEILKCRGEGESEECDVIYYTDTRQTGKRIWQKTSKIRGEERIFKDSILTAYKNLAAVRKKTPSGNKNKTSPISGKKPSIAPIANKKIAVEKRGLSTVKKDQTKAPPSDRVKKIVATQKTRAKTDTVKIGQNEVLHPREKVLDTSGRVNSDTSLVNANSTPGERELEKLSIFIDCSTGCDINYIRTDLTIVDFLLDMKAADVHVLINEQKTGSGGSSIQMILYGQHKYKSAPDTLTVIIAPNSTEFERRAEMLQGIKRGLIPFLLKTGYAKYIDVKINVPGTKQVEAKSATRDPWNYWVFNIGSEGTLSSDQVYKSTRANGYVLVNRTTDKLKIVFENSGSYNNYVYTYDDNGTTTKYNVINSDYLFKHSLIAGLGSHWGIGYQGAYSNNTFANNKSRLYGKAAIEYSIFPYKDVNTRFFTLTYGVDVRANAYFDTTIYFKKKETLYGQSAQANISFNQKWGTFSSSISYSNFFKDPSLSNLSATLNLNIRITGGLSFYIYTYAARVRDQVYLVKGKASEQDVLTRRRQLASEYNFDSGVGLNFRFGSKLNNFVNPRMRGF